MRPVTALFMAVQPSVSIKWCDLRLWANCVTQFLSPHFIFRLPWLFSTQWNG